jgi:dUTP pyrophosphatase
MTTIDNIQDQPSEIEEIKQTNEHSNGSDIEATDALKSKRRNKKTDQDQLNNNDSKSIAEEINSPEQAQAKEINSSEQEPVQTQEQKEILSPQILKFFKLSPSSIIPKFATEQSACFDLTACFEIGDKIKCIAQSQNETLRRVTDRGIAIHPNERFLIPTGLILDIPQGYCVEVYIRSGISYKLGLTLNNCVGIIDSDYTEQLYISVANNSGTAQYIQKGERIAQAKLVKLVETVLEETLERPGVKTDRVSGFGSTGKN